MNSSFAPYRSQTEALTGLSVRQLVQCISASYDDSSPSSTVGSGASEPSERDSLFDPPQRALGAVRRRKVAGPSTHRTLRLPTGPGLPPTSSAASVILHVPHTASLSPPPAPRPRVLDFPKQIAIAGEGPGRHRENRSEVSDGPDGDTFLRSLVASMQRGARLADAIAYL